MTASLAATTEARYFRSDGGVAGAGTGSFPDNFDAPGALRWRVPVDAGHSSAILGAGKIFLTYYHRETKELATVALDESTGQTLWRRGIKTEYVEPTHPIGSPATATPACDGQRLFVFFGSYGLICYDFEGKTLWEHRLGPFRDEYGAGSSPIVMGDKVILSQDHDLDSFLAAFDAVTGNTIWKVPRPDAVRSYSTPAVWSHDGRKELIVAGALELAGYDQQGGEKLWWINGLARIVIPTPVPSGEMIYMASWAPGGDAGRRIGLDPWTVALSKWDRNHDGKLSQNEITDREVLDRFFRMDLDQSGELDQKEWERHAEVFRLAQNAVLALKPSSARGELKEKDVIWKYQRGVPYVSTPVLDHGILWMVKDGGLVTKLDAIDGRVLQEERVPGIGNYFASPVAGNGKVYFASEQGVISVVASDREWKLISSREFHEKIYATPAMDRGRMYVRTEQALYCFQGGAPQDSR